MIHFSYHQLIMANKYAYIAWGGAGFTVCRVEPMAHLYSLCIPIMFTLVSI